MGTCGRAAAVRRDPQPVPFEGRAVNAIRSGHCLGRWGLVALRVSEIADQLLPECPGEVGRSAKSDLAEGTGRRDCSARDHHGR